MVDLIRWNPLENKQEVEVIQEMMAMILEQEMMKIKTIRLEQKGLKQRVKKMNLSKI